MDATLESVRSGGIASACFCAAFCPVVVWGDLREMGGEEGGGLKGGRDRGKEGQRERGMEGR